MLDDLNPAKFNLDFTEYDRLTAVYCAQLSEIAYWEQGTIDSFYEKIKTQYPDANSQYTFIEYSSGSYDTQVLLWGTKEFLVISFRGTEPKSFRDWFSDSKFWNYRNNPDYNDRLANLPPGHGGFRMSLINLITKRDLFRQIDETIQRCNARADLSAFPIYLTGHSLGAAISQMMMEPLKYKEYHFAGAYHFAPPLAVSTDLKDYMQTEFGNKVYDIVNYKDYVPRAGRNNVSHFGKFYRICKNGLLYKEKEAYIKFRWFEYFSQARLHALSSHLKAVKDDRNSKEKIVERSIGDYPCLKPKVK